MAVSNQYMEAAANTIFELSSDEFVREQCRAKIKKLKAELAKTKNE